MKIPNLIPPSDLLQRVDGVEDGLRKRRRLGLAGLLGVVASAGQIVIVAFNSDWLAQLRAFGWQELFGEWRVLLGLSTLVASALLFVWARFWLHESRRPFKYTYHIEQFRPIHKEADDHYLGFLAPDLSERLSDRIMRLSRFDESTAPPEALEQRRSHLHIEGYYLIRVDADRRWVVEVTPWVRMGQAGSRQTLALPVKAPIGNAGSEAGQRVAPSRPPALSIEQYETILERVYFSIATEVYKQIRHDVQRKIDLLPTRYFRAVAYHNEAMDYARSNTLDAYEAARELFDAAIGMYDPSWLPASPSRLRRALRFVGRKLPFRIGRGIRRLTSRIVPRVGRLDVMIARAKLGYADMILYRHILAGMSGQTLSSIFEARPVAHRAVDELHQTAVDVPGRRAALFDGYVTLASIYFYLDAIGVEIPPGPYPAARTGWRGAARNWWGERRQLHPSAWSYLNKAHQLDPIRVDRDPHYQFAFGKLQSEIRWELRFLRRAFELDRKFEAAQFELALRSEMQWRARDTLEPAVADLVMTEYKRVLRLNPGNISALGRLGDMYWLLAQVVDDREAEYRQFAKDAFARGRDSKLIRQDTFVAELDYGLARLAAEAGEFQTAYEHYMNATSAHVAYGVAHARGGYTAQFHFFDRIGDQVLDRYRRYFETVESQLRQGGASDRKSTRDRVQEVVLGLAFNDYGEACLKYWIRHGDDAKLEKARELFEQAYNLVQDESVFPAYNAYLLERYRDEFRPAARWISEVERLEPNWSDAQLAKRAIYTGWALRADSVIQSLDPQINTLEDELIKLKSRRDNWLHPSSAPMVVRVTAAEGAGSTSMTGTPHRRARLGAGPGSSADTDKAYATLVRGVDRVEVALADLKRRRADQQRFRDDALAKVSEDPRREVPHEWLAPVWDRPTSSKLSRLYRESGRDWLRWERELNDVHVRILISWVSSLLVDREHHEIRSDAAHNGRLQEFSRSLLEWLQQHFWPDDPDVLAGLIRVAADDSRRQECSQRLWQGFYRELQEDPKFITVMRALFDEASFSDNRERLIRELRRPRHAGAPGFRPVVWLGWGDKLLQQGDTTTAVMAYEHALLVGRKRLSREEPQVFVELGDRLADLGQWPESESAYELAYEFERELG